MPCSPAIANESMDEEPRVRPLFGIEGRSWGTFTQQRNQTTKPEAVPAPQSEGYYPRGTLVTVANRLSIHR